MDFIQAQAEPLTAAQVEMLALLLEQMLATGGNVSAPKFRADNYDQIQILDALEADGMIIQAQHQYVLHSAALPLLKTEPAKLLLASIERIYQVLRARYRETQHAPVKVAELAAACALPCDEVSAALRMMLDNTLWWSGSSTDLTSADAFVSPAEKILQYGTFAEMAAQVRSWRARPTSSQQSSAVLKALRESEGGFMSVEKAAPSMKNIQLSRGVWTISNTQLGPAGGFAAVYLGTSAAGEPVAIKVFHSAEPDKSKRELMFANQRLGRLDAHVIPILDCGVDATTGHACIVMPKADRSLAQLLELKGSLDEAEAVAIGHSVVSGLLSAIDWVHRDLKPGNLLWCNGRWQVSDFGIARHADAKTAKSTMKGYVSDPYAAPEQWNTEHATHKTDVYALACLLQQVMTGEPPFPGPEQVDYAYQHRWATPENLAGSHRMKAVLSRMLSKSPDARPSLDELEQRFKEWEKSESQTPAAQGLAAVAARLAGIQMQQQVDRASAEQKQLSRATLESDAQRELKRLAEALFGRILNMAPNAIVEQGRGLTPSISASLGNGRLMMSVGQFSGIARESFNESHWDVICGGVVMVDQDDGQGRSASLWYVRRWPNSPYEWVEVSYWCLGQSENWHKQPCLLSPGEDADLAAANIMHTWNLAHQPISLKDDGCEAFVERWLTRFTAVAGGAYQRPSTLPEL